MNPLLPKSAYRSAFITITVDAQQDLKDMNIWQDNWEEEQKENIIEEYLNSCRQAATEIAQELAKETAADVEINVLIDDYRRDEYYRNDEWFNCDLFELAKYRQAIWQRVLDMADFLSPV